MSVRRITIGIFSAPLTFSIGVAVAWFCFVPRQVVVPREVPALSQKGKPFEIQRTQPSLLKERAFPDVWDAKTTVAGKLEIVETDFLEWKIVLNGNQVLADGDLPPQISAQITNKISPFDEIIVFTQASGTCCEFGRFWFLGLKSDGSYHFSKPVGNGFAHVPKVTFSKDYVKVKVRGGRENHGEYYLPGGEWIFKNGRVRKVK
jgi:hypothetical protein